MKKLLLYLSLALILAVGVDIPGASAALLKSGTIFLSGDMEIISLEGIPENSGNGKFFQNILQGGTNVVVLDNETWEPKKYFNFWNTINAFYDGLDKVDSSLITVIPKDLTGVNLFIAPLPDNEFTKDEISALQSLLKSGGSVFFLGDCPDPDNFVGYNDNINKALTALGSGMSIVNTPNVFFDEAFTQPIFQAQIADDIFTTGVNTFTYVSPSQVSGGTPLFFGTKDKQGQPRPIVAYEVVPLPASAWLLGSGLLGLGFFRRKGRKSPAA